jgi:non-ribosomal peptide synthetase component F
MNEAEMDPSTLSTETLLQMLRQDRLWLLRQIDSGRWPQWRLDLAALERELGLLLDQAADRCPKG